ncbi:hypothetical protein CH333_00300 [candidate division WOR-3 bacterium JGI_Cruoil_03_44_89]|uniref:Polysaccharide biosynthesis protein CapD-like domain-containing protein n=1 Tax=candidate division WOR-3 bacterium JGI_Cruoil_03_44_89 TaxID=1973748 RepID=A0A235BZ16_UNCW3|nr:MAG: hypothetical protein CH333_00300 [candidate division WOR-3 bacterium JGI_Cruoil_03_44_89]
MFEALIKKILNPKKRKIARNRLRRTGILTPVFDLVLINLALLGAFLLRFNFRIPEEYLLQYLYAAIFITIVRMLALHTFGVYKSMLRYMSVADFINLIKAITTGTIIVTAFMFFLYTYKKPTYPRSIIILEWLLDIILLGGIRFSFRVMDEILKEECAFPKRTLIIGAGDAGEMVVREMRTHPEYGYIPIGFIDDNPKKIGKSIHDVRILGTGNDVEDVVKKKDVSHILIAIPSASGRVVREIIEKCARTRAHFEIVPGIKEIITGDVKINQIRNVKPEDLLGRKSIDVDIKKVGEYLSGKRVLITGAGGSIGKELARQVASLDPEILILFGRGENSLYEVNLELGRDYPEVNKFLAIGNIRDSSRVSRIFQEFKPSIVFHAAAHKHVPLMEISPEEAVKNNIVGTRIVAEEALASNVERFVMISTDKAVNPTSVMGASKKIAEILVQEFAERNKTKFSTVRFGNVLGSRGSVVPLFLRQIENGGPVEVTHPEVKRYFMTVGEACHLVIEAGGITKGGEIFILDMGEPVSIDSLARNLITLSGHEPDVGIKIEYIGLRPGEKLREELMTKEELVTATKYQYLWVTVPEKQNNNSFEKIVKQLDDFAKKGDRKGIFNLLNSLIPTFRPSYIKNGFDK